MFYFIGFSPKNTIFVPILKRKKLRFRGYGILLKDAQLADSTAGIKKPGKSESRADFSSTGLVLLLHSTSKLH